MTIRWSGRPEGSTVTPAQWLEGRSQEIAHEIRDAQVESQLTGAAPFAPPFEGIADEVTGSDDSGWSLLGALFGR